MSCTFICEELKTPIHLQGSPRSKRSEDSKILKNQNFNTCIAFRSNFQSQSLLFKSLPKRHCVFSTFSVVVAVEVALGRSKGAENK